MLTSNKSHFVTMGITDLILQEYIKNQLIISSKPSQSVTHTLTDPQTAISKTQTNPSSPSSSAASVASDDAHTQAMVASFCGRSFDDGETNEIAQRIRRATANINVEIESLMEFLTHKGQSL
jgi:hypothetical protein